MKIEQIKREMLKYRDLFGGDIFYTQEIKEATTKQQLADIIERYRWHLEDALSDAKGHLYSFKKRVHLTIDTIDKD